MCATLQLQILLMADEEVDNENKRTTNQKWRSELKKTGRYPLKFPCILMLVSMLIGFKIFVGKMGNDHIINGKAI